MAGPSATARCSTRWARPIAACCLTGRYPIAFLRLEMPAEAVDVNVHPTKLEVRFPDGGRLYSQLLGTLRTKFLATDLTARVRSATGRSRARRRSGRRRGGRSSIAAALVDWAKGALAARTVPATPSRRGAGPAGAAVRAAGRPAAGARPTRPRLAAAADFAAPARSGRSTRAGSRRSRSATRATSPSRSASTRLSRSHLGFQIHNRYLVTESDEGMVVIDQHALHERILYEQLREKVLAGQLETQRLLVPEPVTLPPAEAAAALEARETLAQLGVEVEPFGGDTVLVSSYPAMLANLSPAEVLRQVVELLVAGRKTPERRDLLDELLHMIACKAAIKAGDRLAPEEITALLEQRHSGRTPTTARTAGPRPWSSPAKSWTGGSNALN